MDVSSNASPQSPAPLALSELMAQISPCSDTTHPSDKPSSAKAASRPDAAHKLTQSPAKDELQTPSTPKEPQETQPPPLTQEEDPTPPPTDWLATRQQLLPRRSQGKKADWIRGWSAAVSSHGDAAYCACSEPIEESSRASTSRGRIGKTSFQLADSVRTALQTVVHPSSSSSSNNNNNNHKKTAIHINPTTPSSHEPPRVCRHCSRPSSPPPSTAPTASSSTSETLVSRKNFTKRLSELFMRVRRPSRSQSQSADKRVAAASAAEMRKMTWPEEYHPRWATTAQGQKRFLSRPASQPLSAPVSAPVEKLRLASRGGTASGGGVMSWFGGDATRGSRSRRGRGDHPRGRNDGVALPSSSSSSSSSSSELDGIGIADSDERHPRPGLARSMSRLQRAAALLQRATSRPKD